MSVSREASIFVGVPAYRGWPFLDETLQSIADQDLTDFRVLISVDGGDERSAGVCAKYTGDPRFELVVQEERLGWAANLNWLMLQSTGDFFCYWQQDDLCASSYFRVLREHAIRHPEAACVYADMQWFGSQTHCDRMPSVTGAALDRVRRLLDASPGVAFRGLVRAAALKGAGPLRVNAYDSRLEDYVWVVKLAGEGELHHVAGTTYYKRVHSANTHSFANPPDSHRRGIWTEYGLGLLEAAFPLVNAAGRGALLNSVLERLLLSCPGRWMIYDPSAYGGRELVRFADDFVKAATRQFGGAAGADAARLPDPQAVLDLAAAHSRSPLGSKATAWPLVEIGLRELQFGRLLDQVTSEAKLDIGFGAGAPGSALLESGWSTPEPWGVWSDSAAARLRLPIPCDGRTWRLRIHGRALADARAPRAGQTIVARLGDQVVGRWMTTPAEPELAGDVILPAPRHGAERILDFDFPDAVSPAELGGGEDRRRLGLALRKVDLECVGAGHEMSPSITSSSDGHAEATDRS
jgi:glycosyltransferase involved in cell wall biosynthesis